MRTCTVFSSRENEGGSRGTFFDDDDDNDGRGEGYNDNFGGTMPIPPVPLVPMLVDLTLAIR